MINKLIKYLKSIDILMVIAMYLILLLFSGYFFFEYCTIYSILITGIWLLILALHKKLSKKTMELAFLLIGIVIFIDILSLTIYRRIDLSLLIYSISILFLSSIFSCVCDEKTFKKNYIDCMIILALGSLILFTVFIFKSSIFELFPHLINSKGKIGYYAIFATLSDFSMTGANRNQGIFWEPGVYQVFLSLAYIFELSENKQKPRNTVLILFLLTILTTYSTTGIIVGGALLIYTLSRSYGKKKYIKFLFFTIISIISIIIVVPKLSGFAYYTLISKIEMIFSYQAGVSTVTSSRIDSIIFPLLSLFKSPWGIGREGYLILGEKIGHTMFTCTPVNWLVLYGPLYGLIILRGIWLFFKNDFKSNFDAVFIFIIFVISISSEDLSFNIILLYMCFKGYEIKRKRGLHKNENCSN